MSKPITEIADPTIVSLAKRLHSQNLTPVPHTDVYELAVRALQHVPTSEEASQFRATWDAEHAAWVALSQRTSAADIQRAREDENLLESALRGEYEHIGGDLPWPSFRLRRGAAVLRALARDADDVAEPILAEEIESLAGRVEQAANADDAIGRKRREKAAHVLDVVERWARDHRDDKTGEVSQVEIDTIGKLALDAAGYTIAIAPVDVRREKAEVLFDMVKQWMGDRWVTGANDFHELSRMRPEAIANFARQVCKLASESHDPSTEAVARDRRQKADALLAVVERWMSETSASGGTVINFRQAVLVPFVCDIVAVMESVLPSEKARSIAEERDARWTKAEALLSFCERWVSTCGTKTDVTTTFVADDLCRLADQVCAVVEDAQAKVTPMYEATSIPARAGALLAYVEQWCKEHEIGPYENIPAQLRGMLATALLHFAVGVCARAVPKAPETTTTPAEDAATPPAPCASTSPLPFWDGPHHISVDGRPLQVRSEDGKLDYKLLAERMAEVAAMNLTREVRSTFNTLISNAVFYEESRGVPLANSNKPTDGNVLLAYNRCAAVLHNHVSRIALLVEMRNAGIGSDLKERRDYMEDMIRRGLLSLTNGGDPLLLGSHPSTAPGSAAS